MQKEQGKASEEGADAIRRVGAPEDEMAALERQLAPAVIPALQGGTRALGFVSAGIEIQGSAGEVKNPDEIELGEDDDDEEEVEESEKIELLKRKCQMLYMEIWQRQQRSCCKMMREGSRDQGRVTSRWVL